MQKDKIDLKGKAVAMEQTTLKAVIELVERSKIVYLIPRIDLNGSIIINPIPGREEKFLMKG